jgi:hypothetical protein
MVHPPVSWPEVLKYHLVAVAYRLNLLFILQARTLGSNVRKLHSHKLLVKIDLVRTLPPLSSILVLKRDWWHLCCCCCCKSILYVHCILCSGLKMSHKYPVRTLHTKLSHPHIATSSSSSIMALKGDCGGAPFVVAVAHERLV